MIKQLSISFALAALGAAMTRTASAADYNEGQWVTTFTLARVS